MKKLVVMAAAMMLLGSTGAWAAHNYTKAGTSISNSASLSFSVSSVPQTNVTSNTDTFVVDNKIDLVVTHSNNAYVEVVPGATGQYLTYTVRNDGNKIQDYSLVEEHGHGDPWGGTDNFDGTGIHIYVDSDNNGVYDSAIDTATYIDALEPDKNVSVFIVVDTIPADRHDGDIAQYTLVAQVANGDTNGTQGADITSDDRNVADDQTVEQIVFADGIGNGMDPADIARNGKHSDYNAFKVVTADLDLVKLSCAYSDPITDGGANSANAKRIPGATITYVFDINNTGSVNASDVNLSDTFVSELDLTSSVGTVTVDKDIGSACVCNNGQDKGGNSGTNVVTTNAVSGQVLTVKGIEITSSSHTCVSVKVDIK